MDKSVENNNSREEFHPFCCQNRNIQWNRLKVKYAVSDIDYAIGLARDRIAVLRKIPLDQVNFENILMALEYVEEELGKALSLLSHLDSVNSCDEITKVVSEILPKVSEFTTSIPLDFDLWERVNTYAKSREADRLSQTQKRLLKNTVDLFVDHGANLNPEAKTRLLEISSKLSQLCYKFGDNVLSARNDWEKFVSRDSLSGLPEPVVKSMAQDAEQSGKTGMCKISLEDNYVVACGKYLDDDDLRKEILIVYKNLCRDGKFSNLDIVNEILALKDEEARLLGNDSYSNFTLKHNMLKTKSAVDKFLAEIYEKVKSQFGLDAISLKSYAEDFYAKLNLKNELTPWNNAYLVHKKMQSELGEFNEEQLRPYFEISNVMSGLFKIVEELYGIKIAEKKTVFLESEDDKCPDNCLQVWDKDVKYYEVFEGDGKFIGGFFADLYPRKNKHSGAWCSDLITGGLDRDGNWTHPIGVICANVTKPSHGGASLLLHHEITTIFHEFGHLMHLMFGKVGYPSLNGYHVAMDFVELPSQLMENFCWERRSLDLFAKHHITGELIPSDLFDKLLKSRTFMESLSLMKQLEMAVMDLELHGNYSKYRPYKMLDDVLNDTLSKYMIKYSEKTNSILYRFCHIFSGGYASEYYSYMWSEVLDADAFTVFQSQGVINREVGNLFRSKILSVGDSVDPLESFRFFVHRDPDINPFLVRRGCLKFEINEKNEK
ncbi:MAG: M3 family metallopeptidase [Puniceicoccales bacterium]|nr:M3 family metallopeptidase [Puniceicoccales bacterium]